MSTIGEEATEWCASLAGRYGVGFVDAPMLGTRQPAERGQLVVPLIARRLVQGTGEHGDKDVSATYLTGAPEQAA